MQRNDPSRRRDTPLSSRRILSCYVCARLYTHHVPHVSREGEDGVLAVVDAMLVEVAHVKLHRSVVLGLDEAVGPAALAGNVKVDVFSLGVDHLCFVTAEVCERL